MSLNVIPSLTILRWVTGKGVLFALLGLIALDGGPFVTSAFAFQLSSSSLTFTAVQNGANPAPQTISLSKFGGRTKTWTVSPSASWLTVSPMSGTISTETDTITTSVLTSGMAAGTYNASISVSMQGSSPKTIHVSLTLTAAALTPTSAVVAPAIGLNPTSLSFAGTAGGTNPAAQSIAIANVGGGTLTWTASSNAAWLALSPLSGTNTGSITATANLAGLLAGTYSATVTVSATGATTKTLPVTLTITSAVVAPAIGLNPTSLSFAGTAGGTNPAAQSIAIANVGGGTLTWTASSNAAWLALSPLSGTNTGSITATANLAGLLAGTYSATVTVSATGATTKTLPVTLTITAATTASTAGLAWNANSETDLAGYKVYQGTSSGTYAAPVATIPKGTTSYTVTGLQTGTTYFFVITAYDSAGNESPHSTEVSKSIY